MKVGFYFFVTATNQTQARAQAVYFSELIRNIPMTAGRRWTLNNTAHCPRRTQQDCLGICGDAGGREQEKRRLLYQCVQCRRDLGTGADAVSPLDCGLWAQRPTSLGYWTQWAGFQYEDNGGCPELRARWTWIGLLRVCCWSRAQRCPFWMCVLRTGMQKGVTELFERDCCRGLRRTGLDRTVPPNGLRW